MRESAYCTLRVLEVILNLLELLMEMGVLKQCLRDEALSSSTPMQDSQSPAKNASKGSNHGGPEEADKGGKPMNAHRLVMHTIVRYVTSYERLL